MKSYNLLDYILKHFNASNYSKVIIEKQNIKYESFHTKLDNNISIHSRLAKKTPKKQGYFIALYHKDRSNINIPYSNDNFSDYLICFIIDRDKYGFFVFSKKLLVNKGILTSSLSPGKMAFRVYTPWDKNLNLTATKTQQWQTPYFTDLSKYFFHKYTT